MAMGIKVCGFTHPEDVACAVTEDLDALGVVLDRGPDRVDRPRADELIRAARGSGKELVAVAGAVNAEEVLRLLEAGFDRVQAVLQPAQAALLPMGAPVLPVLFDDDDLLERFEALRTSFPFRPVGDTGDGGWNGLLNVDGKGGGGTGARANRDRAADLAARVPMVFSGGLTAGNVAEAIHQVRPVAVDVSSYTRGPEGRKDFDRIRGFIRAVRSASAETTR